LLLQSLIRTLYAWSALKMFSKIRFINCEVKKGLFRKSSRWVKVSQKIMRLQSCACKCGKFVLMRHQSLSFFFEVSILQMIVKAHKKTTSGTITSEMQWCVVSIYLTDPQLLPHSPTGRCTVPKTPISHTLTTLHTSHTPHTTHLVPELTHLHRFDSHLHSHLLTFICTPTQISQILYTSEKAGVYFEVFDLHVRYVFK